MSNILVSICCTTFNHEKFISHALDGFLMQKTNFTIEILINDDCSEDGTVDILKDYNNRFSGLFDITFQSENQYSKGIKPFSQMVFPKAKGKYIALCEGDDYWTDPNKLQKQVDFLEKNLDHSMCFHRCIIVDENNNEMDSLTFSHLEDKEYLGDEILEKWSVPTASVVFRAEFLKQILQRAKTKGYLYGDTPMFLTLIDQGKARCFGDIMSAYRIHEGGISRSLNKENILSLYKHYQTLRKDFNGKYRKIMTKNISKYAFGASTFFIRKWHLLYGIKFFLVSIAYDQTPLKDFVLKKFFGKENPVE